MKKLVILFLILFPFLHLGINALLPTPINYTLLLVSHLFLIAFSVAGYYGILFFESFKENSIGFAFLAFSTFKMLFAAGFIAIAVLKFGQGVPFALHFMVIYFIYLGLVSAVVYHLVTNKNKEKQEVPTEV